MNLKANKQTKTCGSICPFYFAVWITWVLVFLSEPFGTPWLRGIVKPAVLNRRYASPNRPSRGPQKGTSGRRQPSHDELDFCFQVTTDVNMVREVWFAQGFQRLFVLCKSLARILEHAHPSR